MRPLLFPLLISAASGEGLEALSKALIDRIDWSGSVTVEETDGEDEHPGEE